MDTMERSLIKLALLTQLDYNLIATIRMSAICT